MRVLHAIEELNENQARILALLGPVMDAARGEFTIADLLALAAEKRVHIALDDDICFAFEFRHYPAMTAVNIIAIGGAGLDTLAERYLPAFKRWAAGAGASRIEASCSKAMARILKAHGFTNDYEQVSLAVGEAQ